ncbi:MAG: class F sortase [Dehalococcoidia bacterium]
MGSISTSPQGPSKSKRLLQRLLLVGGAALFVVGGVILAIGLVGYFSEGDEGPTATVVSELPTTRTVDSIASVPQDPLPTAAEPEPAPEPGPDLPAPLRLVIEGIAVDAPIVELGMDGEGIPYVPLNGQDVAWYNFSTKPGAGSNAVFAAHINWERAAGVFSELTDVQLGDTVRLISDDGREYTYEVFANFAVDPLDPASLKVMDPTSEDTVTLITCGGTWIPDASERFGGNYTDRTIVQARLIESVLAETAAFSDGGD